MSSQDNIHVLSRAVIIHDNKILLCKTLDLEFSFYFLPGGHIEHGESAEKFLLRELKEETSSDCKIICPEKHIELIWMTISSLQEIDFRAELLQKLLPLWLTENKQEKFMSEMI